MLKKKYILFISVLTLFFLCFCNDVKVPQSTPSLVEVHLQDDCTDLQKQCDSLTQVIQEQDSMLIKTISLFSDIQNNFNSMKGRKEKMYQYVREADDETPSEIKKNFSSYIKNISILLLENQKKLEELKLFLTQRNVKVTSLKFTISAMEKELNMRNNEIKLLKHALNDKDSELSLLENMIAVMNDEFKNMGTVIKQQQEQLNTAWYCVADKKTLLNSALISKKGKVLSIDAALVTKIDIQKDKEILIHAKRYELLTAHPVDSYQIIQSGNNVEKLHILNPEEFWSICKYCVIQVKK